MDDWIALGRVGKSVPYCTYALEFFSYLRAEVLSDGQHGKVGNKQASMVGAGVCVGSAIFSSPFTAFFGVCCQP
jgi:hypothetical protein